MRTGCEVEKWGSESKFSKGVYEYGYDGEDFLSFDDKESQWVAPVAAALPTKSKWNNVPMLNQYTKGYLEKECVAWLNKFTKYEENEIRNGYPPEGHIFLKRSIRDKSMLKLSCMVTGFYPKDTALFIRKYRTSLPEDETESTGIRPNHDGTFQIKKSVEIKEDEEAEYGCFVAHRTLSDPIIIGWVGKCQDCSPEIDVVMIAAVTGAVLVLLLTVAGVALYILKKKGIIGQTTTSESSDISSNSSVDFDYVY